MKQNSTTAHTNFIYVDQSMDKFPTQLSHIDNICLELENQLSRLNEHMLRLKDVNNRLQVEQTAQDKTSTKGCEQLFKEGKLRRLNDIVDYLRNLNYGIDDELIILEKTI